MAHNYEVGTRAWQPDATEGWVASEVEEKQVAGDKVKLVFQLANGEVRPPHARNEQLRLLSQPMERQLADMTALLYSRKRSKPLWPP